MVPAHAELRVGVHHPEDLQSLLLVLGLLAAADEGNGLVLARVAHDVVLELVGVALQGLHGHQGRLHHAIETLIVALCISGKITT